MAINCEFKFNKMNFITNYKQLYKMWLEHLDNLNVTLNFRNVLYGINQYIECTATGERVFGFHMTELYIKVDDSLFAKIFNNNKETYKNDYIKFLLWDNLGYFYDLLKSQNMIISDKLFNKVRCSNYGYRNGSHYLNKKNK